jgi:hypothetical protein
MKILEVKNISSNDENERRKPRKTAKLKEKIIDKIWGNPRV